MTTLLTPSRADEFLSFTGNEKHGEDQRTLVFIVIPPFFLDDFNRISFPLKITGKPPRRAGSRLAGHRARTACASFPAAESQAHPERLALPPHLLSPSCGDSEAHFAERSRRAPGAKLCTS